MKPDLQNLEYDDDAPVGRVLSRREVLRLLAGLGGAAVLAACGPLASDTATPAPATTPTTAGSAPSSAATPTTVNAEAATAVAATPVAVAPTADTAAVPDCVVRPELTEGPYFVDEKINRSDIRADISTGVVKEGVPLTLAFAVSQVGTGSCTPLQGAQVDIWHCDALGVYSDVQGSTGTKFLRGYQVTDANGQVQFQTIFPGWYSGRAVHIHFKVRTDPDSSSGAEFTSQFFFDEGVIDTVMQNSVYSARGTPNVRNSTDNIYTPEMLITLAEANGGYSGSYHVGVNFA